MSSGLHKVQEGIIKTALQVGRNLDDISLVVVTKKQPISSILKLYQEGYRDFGENRVQEAAPKIDALPKDILWHFIGRLQKNKVAKVVGTYSLIHSVDSLELAQKIDQVCLDKQCQAQVLLEVNTSLEPSKAGLSPEEWKACFSKTLDFKRLIVKGLMTIGPNVEDVSKQRASFSLLRRLRDELEGLYGISLPFLSMGMSNDYQMAIEEGATHVRIGSAIFDSLEV